MRAATSGALKIWRDGYRYSKAGLVTVDLVPLAGSQRALPGMDLGDRDTSASLMAAIDACNRRFGRGAVVPSAAGFAPLRDWSTGFDMRSPRYTTRLDKLPMVQAAWTHRRPGWERVSSVFGRAQASPTSEPEHERHRDLRRHRLHRPPSN